MVAGGVEIGVDMGREESKVEAVMQMPGKHHFSQQTSFALLKPWNLPCPSNQMDCRLDLPCPPQHTNRRTGRLLE